jgi:hypothetical protein
VLGVAVAVPAGYTTLEIPAEAVDAILNANTELGGIGEMQIAGAAVSNGAGAPAATVVVMQLPMDVPEPMLLSAQQAYAQGQGLTLEEEQLGGVTVLADDAGSFVSWAARPDAWVMVSGPAGPGVPAPAVRDIAATIIAANP